MAFRPVQVGQKVTLTRDPKGTHFDLNRAAWGIDQVQGRGWRLPDWRDGWQVGAVTVDENTKLCHQILIS